MRKDLGEAGVKGCVLESVVQPVHISPTRRRGRKVRLKHISREESIVCVHDPLCNRSQCPLASGSSIWSFSHVRLSSFIFHIGSTRIKRVATFLLGSEE